MLEDTGVKYDGTIPLYCDKHGVLRLAKIPIYHSKMKHVEIHHHFICEKVQSKEILCIVLLKIN